MATIPLYWRPNSQFVQKLMLDISQAQRRLPPDGDTDWSKFLAMLPPVEAVWIRSGISWGYTDPWFHFFRDALRAAGRPIPTAAYHVIYPSQPALAQWKKKRAIVGVENIKRNGASMWDGELRTGQSRKVVTQRTFEVLDAEAQETGIMPLLYTRPYFVRDCMEWGASWYDNVRFVMALYTWSGRERNPNDIYTVLKEPAMKNVGITANRIVAVQTAKMGNGRAYGFQSRALDYDRWMLDTVAFNELWGLA